MIPFGPYAPDQPDWTASQTATNVLPTATGYMPVKAPVAFGNAGTGATRGAFAATNDDGSVEWFRGTATQLQKFNFNTSNWDNVSKSGNYTLPTNDIWQFVQFGTKVIAAHLNDVLQVYDLSSSSLFADIAGSPQARVLAIVNNHVVCGNLSGDPDAVKWSDVNDETTWTSGGVSLADEQDLPDGGAVTHIANAQIGLVFLERAIHRMAPSLANTFEFQKLIENNGLRSPRGVATRGNVTFILANDGFAAITPDGAAQRLGNERVNRTFLEAVDTSLLYNVDLITDPVHTRLYVNYPTPSAGNGAYDRQLVYDWTLDRWSALEIGNTGFFAAATQGTTLEELDALFPSGLESVAPSLDSRVWQGGAPVLGVFGTDNKIAFLSGDNLEATIDTPELQFSGQHRAFLRRVAPALDSAAGYVSIGTRERHGDAVAWGSEVQVEASGRASVRASSRHHRMRLRIPSGTAWTDATGMMPYYSVSGQR